MSDIDTIYNDLESQFEPCVLKTKSKFVELLNTKKYKLNTFKTGYIFYYQSRFILIDYFAIYKIYQGKGFGTKILNEFFEIKKDFGGVYFEVEQIDKNNIQTIRRQNFYLKLGCKKLDFKYYFPNDEKELELDLFYFPLKNLTPNNEEIYNFILETFALIHNAEKSKYATLKKNYENNFKNMQFCLSST